ncbi:hypothetical protein [Aquimarina sp. Aq107]|nr:hypothetical protein [Aquimarina sp. Aq107]
MEELDVNVVDTLMVAEMNKEAVKMVIANPAKKRNKKIRLVTGFFYFI